MTGRREAASHKEHFFEAVARFLGPAYLRYSFTKGTEAEVTTLCEILSLRPGELVLDVGCGPGRHSLALQRRGLRVVGVEIAEDFVKLAAEGAERCAAFVRGDVRSLPVRAGSIDAVISLCQGGFGLLGGDEEEEAALSQMARALRVGGRLALSAPSAYFAIRYLEEGDSFHAERGLNHERSVLRGADGTEAEYDLWTTCFTPREMRLLCSRAGLAVRHMWSVSPGRYRRDPPDLDHPELLVVADKR